jgi:hypothetical protein
MSEEGVPEWQLFIEIELQRQSNFSSPSLSWFQVCEILLLEGIDIQPFRVIDERFRAYNAVTFISAYQLTTSVEDIDRQQTVVGASFAVGCLRPMGEVFQLREGEGSPLHWDLQMLVTGMQGTPIGTHESCFIDPDYLTSQFRLKRT